VSKYTFREYLIWLYKAIKQFLFSLDKLESSPVNIYRGLIELFIFLFSGILLIRLHKIFVLLLVLAILRFSYFLWRAEKLNEWPD